MKKFKIFCFGFGQVAKNFAKSIVKKKIDFELVTTNTIKTQIKELDGIKYKSYYFLDNKFDKDLIEELNSSNKVLISIPPKNNVDIVLEKFKKFFEESSFDWVTYLSATSVYGNHEGQWVNENTNPKPTSKRGIERLNAEISWLNFFKESNLPVQIFRLAGIYSFENNILERLKTGTARIVEKKNHFFSRIHVDDIAEILSLSLKTFKAGEVFNISDDYPCSNKEITEYTANLMKIKIPNKIKVNDIKSKMLKEFYKDSKKISNKKMKSFFSYELKYPTFKEGLNAIKSYVA
jgi:nucleoside-diphosphate-sugar epimerase